MATALHAEEEIDLEKKEEPFVSASAYDEDSTSSQGKTAVASRTGGLWNLTHKLAQYGVEEQGIERFDENQRNHKQVYTLFTMWFTTNCTISTMSLGTLGASIWYLGAWALVLDISRIAPLTSRPFPFQASKMLSSPSSSSISLAVFQQPSCPVSPSRLRILARSYVRRPAVLGCRTGMRQLAMSR